MPLLRRIWCRTFQTGFRIALPILPYTDPKLLYRPEEVVEVLEVHGLRRPLLVTDGAIRDQGLTAYLEGVLEESGTPAAVYDGTRPNPTTEMVESALTMYRENGCDSLIAFGGGSSMDCAKAVGVRLARPRKPLGRMAGILKVMHKLPPLIAIPTTAGTGSETTLTAVIVDAETRHKYCINDFNLIPDYALLDHRLIHGLPRPLMAATGMDALTHAVEAYIGRTTTVRTRRDALEAVRLVFENLERAAAHQSAEAEKEMLRAAHLAGRAFTRSYVGYIHAVSHSLSGKYDLPHGQTNATLLPLVLEEYGPAVYPKLAQLAQAAGLLPGERSEEELARAFLGAVRDLNDRLGIPRTIPGIREEDIPALARHADREANPLYPVPVLWSAEELEEIYRKVGADYGRA